jgi:hypothetical protein
MPRCIPVRATLVACTLIAAGGCTVQPVVSAPPVHAEAVVIEPPPPLPAYEQPPCPVEGYLWTPGYWAYATGGYFWVPGTWVMPPRVGVVWTPGYWAFGVGGRYLFHDGYWGARVGFYGGINYGGGYVGTGFVGGRWEGGAFRYNAEVTNVVNVRNVYHETVINTVTVNNVTVNNETRVSYSGGRGGARSEPTEDERAAQHLPHLAATASQARHQADAAATPALFASRNQGHPAIAATPRPSAFDVPQLSSARVEPATRAPREERAAEAPPPATRLAQAAALPPASAAPAATVAPEQHQALRPARPPEAKTKATDTAKAKATAKAKEQAKHRAPAERTRRNANDDPRAEAR